MAAELRQVAVDLIRRLRAESADQQLSLSQTSVLVRLHKEGPSTVADLARAEHVKPQSMGTTVASLEEAGLVARKADATDGRRWNASLTEAGKRVLLSGRAARQAWLSRAIEERLSDGEQRRLAEAIALLRKVLDDLPSAGKVLERSSGYRRIRRGVASAYRTPDVRAFRLENPDLAGRKALRSPPPLTICK